MRQHLALINLRHDAIWMFAFIGVNSILANFLPQTALLKDRNKRLYLAYCWLVDFIATCAGNWRTQLPSLDQEFMGMRRPMRHYVRNRLQEFFDWRHKDDTISGDD
jgi:hypothetical protein